jgi:PKD repeat protein
MSNTKYRFDRRILSFFAFVSIVSLGVFLYKYYTVKKCPDVSFTISSTSVEAGELVMFNNRTQNTESIKWDFGDNSVQVNEVSPTHTYRNPGEFILKLTINDRCQEMRKIVVRAKQAPQNADLVPKFACVSSVTLGKPISFACLSKNCKSWEWRFGETGKVDSREKDPVYKYSTPGPKTVSLVINGRYTYLSKKIVYVMTPEVPKNIGKPAMPKKGPKAPVIPQSPDDYSSYDEMKTAPKKEPEKEKIMSNDDLKGAIISYSKGKTKLSQFSASFCSKTESTTIEANGKLMNFTEFLDKILWQNFTIKELRTIRDSNGCINQVIIKYKKD